MTVTTLGDKGLANQQLASPASYSAGTVAGKPTHMAIGTGTPSSTLLGSELSGARVAFDSKTATSTNVLTMIATFGQGVGTGTITEAGVFDIATANTQNMLLSAGSASINTVKAAGDSLVLTWTWTMI